MYITISEFKLLSKLPDGYNYMLNEVNNRKVVVGVKENEIIGYYFDNDELENIYYSCEPGVVKR